MADVNEAIDAGIEAYDEQIAVLRRRHFVSGGSLDVLQEAYHRMAGLARMSAGLASEPVSCFGPPLLSVVPDDDGDAA